MGGSQGQRKASFLHFLITTHSLLKVENWKGSTGTLSLHLPFSCGQFLTNQSHFLSEQVQVCASLAQEFAKPEDPQEAGDIWPGILLC